MKLQYVIEILEPGEMRYPTCGDYFEDDNGVTHIQICDQGDWKKNLLITVHEMVEEALTRDRGITEKAISDFDFDFEDNRQENDLSEPGDHPNAPYRREHRFSENIERQLAYELGVDWLEYDKNLISP